MSSYPSRFKRDEPSWTIDTIAYRAIKHCHHSENAWDEDYITVTLLDRLNKLSGSHLLLRSGAEVPLRFNAFKQKGRAETNRGDIALVIARWDGAYGFFGTAFLEAKKRYTAGRSARKFAALDQKQIARIAGNVPTAVVALYDYIGEPYADSLRPLNTLDRTDPDVSYPASYRVATLPARQVLSDVANIDALCRFSGTLGGQIVERYLEGADLDLHATAADAIVTAGRAEYMARFSIGEGYALGIHEQHPTLQRFDNIRDVYNEMMQLLEQQQNRGYEPPEREPPTILR